jgi:hypothetical protein
MHAARLWPSAAAEGAKGAAASETIHRVIRMSFLSAILPFWLLRQEEAERNDQPDLRGIADQPFKPQQHFVGKRNH